MLTAVLERGAHAKARLGFDRPGKAIRMPLQFADRDIQHRHLHAAGDIHADRIRNDGVLGGQHAANRQAIAHVRVRHEGAGHCHGQQAGFLHLHHGLVLQSFAPLAVFDRFGARRRRSVHNGFGQFLAQRVLRKKSRIGDDRLHFLFQAGFVPAAEDELGDEIGRPPGGFTQGDAETNKIFGVHNQFLSCSLLSDSRLQAISSVRLLAITVDLEKREAPDPERPLDATIP